MCAKLFLTGGGTSHKFFRWVLNSLIFHLNPYPQRNSVLVLDNASIHHYQPFRLLCQFVGVRIIYLPPYSPHLNLIELFWNALKYKLRKYYRWGRRNALLTLLIVLYRYKNNFNLRRALRHVGYTRACRD